MHTTLRIFVIGSSKCGKTSFVRSFSDGELVVHKQSDISFDKLRLMIELHGRKLGLTIFDCVCNRDFINSESKCLKISDGIAILYSIADRATFDELSFWYTHVKQIAPIGVKIILVGMKSDLEFQRVVSYDDGRALAESYGSLFIEVSVDQFFNVKLAIKSLICLCSGRSP